MIETVYPPLYENEVDKIPPEWSEIIYLSIPDGVHKNKKTTVYATLTSVPKSFKPTIKCLYSISQCIQLSFNDVKRGSILKSITVVLRLPLYGLMNKRLNAVADLILQEQNFEAINLIKSFYDGTNQAKYVLENCFELAIVDLPYKYLIEKLGKLTMALIRNYLVSLKIVFYSECCHVVSSSVVAFISMIPHLLDTLIYQSKPKKETKFSRLPLETFGFIQPLLTFDMVDQVKNCNINLIAGCCNPILLNSIKSSVDIIINLDNIKLNHTNPSKSLKLFKSTKIEKEMVKNFINQLSIDELSTNEIIDKFINEIKDHLLNVKDLIKNHNPKNLKNLVSKDYYEIFKKKYFK